MDVQKLAATSDEDSDKTQLEADCVVAPDRARRPAYRATSEEKDPSYRPFTISKRWEHTSCEAESKRRYSRKWTLEQQHALEDGVEMYVLRRHA